MHIAGMRNGVLNEHRNQSNGTEPLQEIIHPLVLRYTIFKVCQRESSEVSVSV